MCLGGALVALVLFLSGRRPVTGQLHSGGHETESPIPSDNAGYVANPPD
jgi:hypothetical protein